MFYMYSLIVEKTRYLFSTIRDYLSLSYISNKDNHNINNHNINNISQFLQRLSKDWNNNNINNIDLLCDILILYKKHNTFEIINEKHDEKDDNNYNNGNNGNNDINNINNESNKKLNDEDMKYYITGWYIYQHIKNQ